MRDLGSLFLGRPDGSNALGGSAYLLARVSCLFVGPGACGAGLRVLVLDQFSDLGGAQRNLLLLLGAMRERRWEAMVGLAGEGQLIASEADLL